MNGLVSLALAIDHLDEAQQPVMIIGTAAPNKPTSPVPQPHPWDTAAAIPKRQFYVQTPRVVSVGSEDSDKTFVTASTVSPKNTPEVEELVLTPSDEHQDPPSPPSPEEVIDKVEENDVLCGRGGETNNHVGNIRYRDLVKKYQREYLKAKRRNKPKIARQIVDTIRRAGGRFLKKVPGETTWRDVGNNKAREKTSQALREGAPELREDGVALSAKKKIVSPEIQPQATYFIDQEYKKRKQSPTELLGSISPDANLVSPTPSSGGAFESYVRSVSADDDERHHRPFLAMPTVKKQRRGPRLAILKARLQES